MELDDFVAQTLTKILAGLKKAQEAEDGGAVNAEIALDTVLGSNITRSAAGTFARIDFDVAVTVGSEGGVGAGVKVFGLLEMKAGAKMQSQHVSRISFAVPLRLPDGASSTALAEQRKKEAEAHAAFMGRVPR